MKTQKEKLSLAQAKKMVDNYRNNALQHISGVKMPNFVDFDSSTVQSILNNSEAKGIRAYFAENDDQQVQLFLVGYNEAGDDVLPQIARDIDGDIDPPVRTCPPICNVNSTF